ncbi:uncharacterized protein LOC143226147 [Tachypleus tridentatus]|uniref:uncharacterized protein LOC143226147 n=1 Tax=Tachypleus tridentatus TaxID=6853 RepID=UPI003FCF4374
MLMKKRRTFFLFVIGCILFFLFRSLTSFLWITKKPIISQVNKKQATMNNANYSLTLENNVERERYLRSFGIKKKLQEETDVEQEIFAETWIDDWIDVCPKLSVYSAYYDNRTVETGNPQSLPFVRVFGKYNGLVPPFKNVQCLLSMDRENYSTTDVTGYSWVKICSSLFINCSHKVFTNIVPKWVTIVEKNSNVDNLLWIPVRNNFRHSDSQRKGKIVVCVQPIYLPFYSAVQFAEFVAYYNALGVSHFTFYESQPIQEIKNLILKMVESGISIDLLPWSITWPIPKYYSKEYITFAQFTQLQDCTYRYQYRYEYIVNVDIDEMIVPLKNQNLLQMMESLSHIYSNTAYFRFPLSFLCLNKNPNKTMFEDYGNFQLLQKTWRTPLPETITWYQKNIYKPEKVIYTKQHDVFKLIPGYESHGFNDVALVLHVKNCSRTKLKTAVVDDRTIPKRYGREINKMLLKWFPQ